MTSQAGRLEQMLQDIERDNVSGSVKMAEKTVKLLVESAVLAEAEGRPVAAEAAKWASAAAKAHPFMALVRTVGREAARAGTSDEMRRRLEGLMWELGNDNDRIATHLRAMFPKGGVLMTNSFSATVFASLRSLAEGGREVRAIVVESRPAREGVQLARALGEVGIASTLIVDAGVASFVPRADAVLVGCDAISAGFFVNKLGTLPMILSANQFNVPAYLLSSTHKLVLASELPREEPPRPPDEIVPGPMHGVTVENVYYERVPLELIRGLVTEAGVLTPADIVKRVSTLK
jgi:translation initiation factor 2B subunit (eIF-2B alpha/beta/delta family)